VILVILVLIVLAFLFLQLLLGIFSLAFTLLSPDFLYPPVESSCFCFCFCSYICASPFGLVSISLSSPQQSPCNAKLGDIVLCFVFAFAPWNRGFRRGCGYVSTGSLISWRSVKFRTRSSIKIDTDNSSPPVCVCVVSGTYTRYKHAHAPKTYIMSENLSVAGGARWGAQDAGWRGRKLQQGGGGMAICRVAVYTNKVINFTHDSRYKPLPYPHPLPFPIPPVHYSPAEGLPKVVGIRKREGKNSDCQHFHQFSMQSMSKSKTQNGVTPQSS